MINNIDVWQFLMGSEILNNYYIINNIVGKSDLVDHIIDSFKEAKILTYPPKFPKIILVINELKWDTSVLGFKVADMLFIKKANYKILSDNDFPKFWQRVESCLKKRKIKYLKTRFRTYDLSKVAFLEKNSFHLVDSIIRFNLDLKSFEFMNFPYGVYNFEIKDDCYNEESLIKIGKTIFKHDRFHNDPYILNELADKVYSLWIRNSCNGKIADIVFTAINKDNEPIGFVTCRINKLTTRFKYGYIDLFGVSEKYRGSGVAKVLLLAALKWFYSIGIRYVEIETQVMNIPAIRFYEKFGFKTIDTYFTMRKVFDD